MLVMFSLEMNPSFAPAVTRFCFAIALPPVSVSKVRERIGSEGVREDCVYMIGAYCNAANLHACSFG